MPASTVAIKLLSALRKAASKSSLFETPAAYFREGEEADAFQWLKDHVQEYGSFPTTLTMRRGAGITPVITNEPVGFYANEARKRALWQAQTTPFGAMRTALENKDPDAFVDLCRQVVLMSSQISGRQSGIVTLQDSVGMVMDDYDIAKNTIDLRGIPTPYEFLNEITDGWQNSDVITIVARSGRGKTMFMLYCAWVAWKAGYSVLFLSMEMGIVQLARRMFGMDMGINPNFLRKGNLGTVAEAEMRRQMGLIAEIETPFYWLAGNFQKTVPALRAAAYETEADIIFADASYLLKPEAKLQKHGSRRELIADVIEEIGGLCKELDRPIVQSVQFNRTAVKPKKGEDDQDREDPIAHLSLEKIGETDTIGQVSSIVLGLDYGEMPNPFDERYFGILKGREGERGWIRTHYLFQPFNMGQITNSSLRRAAGNVTTEAPDLSYMDATAD